MSNTTLHNLKLQSSYPKPPHGIHPWSSERRPLLPILPHPPTDHTQSLPELPSPPRRGLIDEWYSLSTHIIPAAFPRSSPDVESPEDFKFSADLTREEKANRVARLRSDYFDLRVRHWNGTLAGNSEKRLWVCVNRYVLRQENVPNGRSRIGRKKLTLFLSHANGFMKEIWEPFLRYLVTVSIKQGGLLFDEIWSWEAVNHGDSALLNRDNLCALYDWSDNTRDTLNFMLNFIPESLDTTLPIHLPRLPPHVSKRRELHGFEDRIVVAIAHSLGGVTTALAAIKCPSLFSSLFVVDSILRPPPLNVPWITQAAVDPSIRALLEGAVQRRDGWSSKEEALKLFKKNSFFAAWDPAVLDVYVECALYSHSQNEVRLKTSRSMEAATFAERRTSFEVWDQLPELDETVELRFVMAGKGVFDHELVEKQELVWLRPKNVSNIKMPSGHLIPHEAPAELALDVHQFIQRKYCGNRARL